MNYLFKQPRYVFLGLLFLFLISFAGIFLWSLRPISHSAEKIQFIIAPKESLSSIAKRLENQKLIKNRYLFQLLVYGLKLNKNIQAGMFLLSPSMPAKEIALNLTKGRLDQWLILIEGWRSEQIAQAVEKQLGLNKEKFWQLSFDKEGFLFPDSYLVPLYFNEEKVLNLILDNFEKKTADLWDLANKKGLGKKEVVILASLVERETKFNEDRSLVAGVLINRWRANWLLQVDASVQYAKANQLREEMGWSENWWPKIKPEDLKINSSYNTYQYKGLPPAPICNPSLASLKAVINYNQNDFWFYVSDKNGKIHLAKNLEEHQKNIQQFVKNQQ